LPEEVRSTIEKRDATGQVRNGAEWLAIWSDPDSLKSEIERRADADARREAEALRARIVASARSLSGNPDLEVGFHATSAGAKGLALTPFPAGMTDVGAVRGEADAKAAFYRHHDPDLHHRLRPGDPDEAKLIDLIEHARCEGFAARAYPGLVDNLTAHHVARLARMSLLGAHLASLIPLAEGLRMVLRDTYAGLSDPSVQTAGFRMWDGWLRARFAGHFARLAETLADQEAHARAAIDFLAALQTELPSRGQHQRRLVPSVPEYAEGEDGQPMKETLDPDGAPFFGPGDEADDDQEPDREPLSFPAVAPIAYRPFTTRHDREVRAEELFDRAALATSRHRLEEKRAAYRQEITRLAARLQRRLLAQQARRWEFDLDEGLIDASRLDRVILSPGFASAYKQEADSAFRDTLVCLLIDNSGSMRGKPIETACVTAEIVAAALERCGIATEILGFTTSQWKGGQSARDWKAAGKPANPGRLNDLLHIVYKDAETPLRRARDALCAMLSPALLKENVDGEALAWAARRMLRRPEARKLLIVVSDGSPVDQFTIEANGNKGILDQHLRQTIDSLSKGSDIAIAAIGLRHDVAQFYSNAVRIETPESLAEALLGLIDKSMGLERAPLRL